MKAVVCVGVCLCLFLALSACKNNTPAIPPGGQGHGLQAANSLNLNSLNLNSLNLNSLNLNSLNLNSLTTEALAAIRDPGANGALARQLLEYAVSCAFDPDQSFSFSWTDATGTVHDEAYPGLLGLAPEWQARSLTPPDEQWVSACLASRVNWYGVSVLLSSRGSTGDFKKPDDAELQTFTHEEGAFWGNLFGATPSLNACFNPANIDYVRSRQRDCAVGHVENGQVVDCGIIHIVGPCDSYCTALHKGYRANCDGSSKVVTVFLQ